MKASFMENLNMIIKNPTSVAALLGVISFVLVFLRIKKVTLNTQIITRIGLALALSVVLHTFRLYHLPQGGSVTLGAMVPLLVIAFQYGPAVGSLAGFTYGIINLIQDPFILHPVQVLFDYPLPFMALGLAGYFRERVMMGTLVAIFGRFICHFISGVVFFANYAPPGMSPYLYAIVFNGSYLLPELVICLIIMRALPLKRIGIVDKSERI